MINRLRKYFCSIRVRYFLVSILALVLGVCTYFIVHALSFDYINTVYSSTENKKEREREYLDDLQSFVVKNNISSEQTGEISKWARENKYVYLLIYKDDQLFYTSDDNEGEEPPKDEGGEEDAPPEGEEKPDTDGEGDGTDNEEKPEEGGSGGVTVDYPTREELLEYAKKNDLYPLDLSDGTAFASIAEFTEYLYYDIANIASFIFAAFIALVMILVYMRFVTSRILRLGKEVNKVAEGDVTHKIYLRGNDEISTLSQNVEEMRNSMIENFRKEKEALDANSELITSMSHDIRTPLTVLLGYIDVMRHHAGDDPAMQEYIGAAESTALRLKKLSDDMFGYFLVFSGKSIEAEMQNYEAATLIQQLLSEHILLMGESGYNVTMGDSEFFGLDQRYIYTDVNKLLRIVDNVFSNLYKYADKVAPVSIYISTVSDKVTISFENMIGEKKDNVESSGIGLKTCKKLSQIISAEFEYADLDGTFHVNLTLPLKDGD